MRIFRAAWITCGLFCIAFSLTASPADAQRIGGFKMQWTQYKARFLQDDGRIVDTGNGGISHSEGQGTGMLFAVFANDRETFDRVWTWTKTTLRRRDFLFSWKYDARLPNDPIADRNNATDGDLLIAWSLLLAAEIWGEPDYREAADATILALEENVVERFADITILMPGAQGFRSGGVRIFNPSYCIFPALQEIANHTGRTIWADVYDGCLALVQSADFGSKKLPVDWIALTDKGTLTPAPEWPARFGYDAIRVPIYLAWGGHDSPNYLKRFDDAWQAVPRNAPPPSWIDPITGEMATYRASNGFLATRRLVSYAISRRSGDPFAAEQVNFPRMGWQDDYYSASLLLFVTLAALTISL